MKRHFSLEFSYDRHGRLIAIDVIGMLPLLCILPPFSDQQFNANVFALQPYLSSEKRDIATSISTLRLARCRVPNAWPPIRTEEQG